MPKVIGAGYALSSGMTSPGLEEDFSIQAGTAVVTFAGGDGTLDLPTAFPKGTLSFVVTPITESVAIRVLKATTRQCPLQAESNGVPWEGGLDVSYLAVGW